MVEKTRRKREEQEELGEENRNESGENVKGKRIRINNKGRREHTFFTLWRHSALSRA
jgi:hypothetical protein